MQSPDGNQPWCPGQSLWSLITEHVSGSELQKIRTALGHSLVDMYTDVHAEVRVSFVTYSAWFLCLASDSEDKPIFTTQTVSFLQGN